MREGSNMKAIVYEGVKQVNVAKVDDPKIKKADDLILKVTSTAICDRIYI